MRPLLHALPAALLLLATPAACQMAPAPAGVQSEESAEAAIRDVLETQQAAWNAGDIERFMRGYWRSPELRFASGGHVVRGYEHTLERYRARYTDRAAMGTLSFDDLTVQQLGPDAAVVYGAWRLVREGDAPSGLFTLVFRRIGGEWKIVSDTTTSAG